MNTSEILNQAADYIEEYGWVQCGGWYPLWEEPACLEGAMRVVTMQHTGEDIFTAPADSKWGPLYARAKAAMRNYLGVGNPWVWNDEIGRTEEEVIEALRAAALMEEVKEGKAAIEIEVEV